MSLPSPTDEEKNFILSCRPDKPEKFFELCTMYGELLYSVNEHLNLTRIPPEDFWSKHVSDSLAVARAVPALAEKSLRLCDVGCGGGLPSFIISSAFPRVSVTAIDVRGKKVSFVADAAEKAGLKNLTALHAKAGELGHKDGYKGAFDIVTARAVAAAPELIKETSLLLKKGTGKLVIYRTKSQAEGEAELFSKMKNPPELTFSEEFTLPHEAGERLFMIVS